MSDSLKYIVAELNKPPFNRNYSLISFDALEGIPLLQVLTDVLAEIEPSQSVDVREEAAEDTAVRLLSMLHVFKYQPEQDIDTFRKGLVEGAKSAIHPLTYWILKRIDELRERAYLARYLVKVTVPAEKLTDPSVADAYEQYLALIETFKEEHREMMARQEGGFGTEEVKKDIKMMQGEMEQVIRTIDKLKKKVEGLPNKEAMLALSQKLRSEADRNNKTYTQKKGQRNLIAQTEQKIERLQNLLKERRQANIGISNESLYTRLVEETNTNKYLATEKLPQEVNEVRALTNDIQRISVEPAMGQSYLDDINYEIKEVSSEINKLIEKKMKSMSSGEKKQSEGEMYRQQASIVRNKKEAVADRFNEARALLSRMETDLVEKRESMGDGMLDHEEFRRLATSMRSMQGRYKTMKALLASLRLENNNLERTSQVLDRQLPLLKKQLEGVESAKGVVGVHDVQDALEHVSSGKSELDYKKDQKAQDNSKMVQELNAMIERKKSTLAPVIRQLRPLRSQFQEVSEKHRKMKEEYDAVQLSLHSTWAHLEQAVTSHTDAINADESNIHYAEMMLKSMEALLERSEAERKSQTSSNKGALRDVLSGKISEAETQSRQLKEKQNSLMDNQGSTENQARTWVELEKMMQVKLKLLTGEQKREGGGSSSGGGGSSSGGGDAKVRNNGKSNILVL